MLFLCLVVVEVKKVFRPTPGNVLFVNIATSCSCTLFLLVTPWSLFFFLYVCASLVLAGSFLLVLSFYFQRGEMTGVCRVVIVLS